VWGCAVGLFGNRSYEEFATILQAANAAFGKGGPDGWTQLKMSDLGIDQFGDTFTSPNGRGKAIVLEKDDELIVAFRGSDKWSDIKDYDKISAVKSYSRQFDKLMEKVAKYQDENDLHTTFTGISLGGAVTNIVAEKAATSGMMPPRIRRSSVFPAPISPTTGNATCSISAFRMTRSTASFPAAGIRGRRISRRRISLSTSTSAA
jgi:hypothetical protein